MHRIRRIDAPSIMPPTAPPSAAAQISGGMFSAPATGVPQALFTPLHYEANYAYPLLVWLHGPGSNEQQLRKIMPLVSLRNYAAVAIRGTRPMAARPPSQGYDWSQSAEHVALAEQYAFEAVEAARRRFHVNSGRVFVAGFDSGGTMAFRLAMNHPGTFAGVLSLCGEFPRGHAPLMRLPEIRRVPVFLAAGRTSGHYAVERMCEDLRLLHAAGLKVTPREYACGQQIDPAMLADVDRWIMQQITGQSLL